MKEGGTDNKVEDAEENVAPQEENPWDKVEKDEWNCPKELTGDAETDEEIAYLRSIVQ